LSTFWQLGPVSEDPEECYEGQRSEIGAAKGGSEASGQLVERYNRLVHGMILHKLRKPDEVEALVQDVFCKAYQELPNLREPEKFAPWLARMAANQAQAWL